MAEQTPVDDEVLDLEQLAPVSRPRVKFPGGKHYHLTVPNDLGLLDSKTIESKQKRVVAIQRKVSAQKVPSEKDVDYLRETITELARMLVHDAPDKEVAALEDDLKLRIIEDFNRRYGEEETSEDEGEGDPLPTTES